MARKKKKAMGGLPPVPGWYVSFTDMASLLMCFFIMMATFSTAETEKFNQMSGALSGAFGTLSTSSGRAKPEVMDPLNVGNNPKDNGGERATPLRRDAAEDIVRGIQKTTDYDLKIDLMDVVGGFRLKVLKGDAREYFKLGTADLTEETEVLLREIALFFKSLPVRIVVETHVDSLTWNFGGFASADDLSERLAVRAAKVLEEAGFVPENVAVAPKGDRSPASPSGRSETATARRENRRIELLVLNISDDPVFSERR